MSLDLNPPATDFGTATSTGSSTAAPPPGLAMRPHFSTALASEAALAPPVAPAAAAAIVYDETVDADHTALEAGHKPGRNPWQNGFDWPIVIFMTLIHILAIGAFFCFTWKGLAILLALGWLTGGIGVCLGYHRLLTHGSFQTYRPVKWLLAFIGQLSGQGSAVTWIANHRMHHAFSDKEGDPHSPHDGGWWSHMLWFTPYFGQAMASTS